jgi:hypothetical protein
MANTTAEISTVALSCSDEVERSAEASRDANRDRQDDDDEDVDGLALLLVLLLLLPTEPLLLVMVAMVAEDKRHEHGGADDTGIAIPTRSSVATTIMYTAW